MGVRVSPLELPEPADHACTTAWSRAGSIVTLSLLAACTGLLAAQFLLGMVTNFYAEIPARVPGLHGNFDVRLGQAARWALLYGPLKLKVHVVIGLATGACAIALAVLALRARERVWSRFALLGLFTVAPAGLAGAAFLAYRQDDLYSLLMSIGFSARSSPIGLDRSLPHPLMGRGS